MGKKSKRVSEHIVKYILYNTTHRVLLWIEQYKNKFAIGDVINLTFLNGCRVTYKDGCLKRYKVVFIDDLGMAYVRAIARKRGYGETKAIHSLTRFDETSRTYLSFWRGGNQASRVISGAELDEGYINSVMLGERFDPRAEYKAKRGIINASN
jgi:hypothetical protein